MFQQFRSMCLKLSLQNMDNFKVNGLMTNTKFTSLNIILDVSLYSYHMQVMGENHVGINAISVILSLCHPGGRGEI